MASTTTNAGAKAVSMSKGARPATSGNKNTSATRKAQPQPGSRVMGMVESNIKGPGGAV